MSGYSPAWLALREGADAAARATSLLDHLNDGDLVPQRRLLVVCDLGCGTGAMGRWLAGRWPGRQHWVLFDRDRDLLDHAATSLAGTPAGGAPITVETRQRDLATLTAADLTATDRTATDPTATDPTATGLTGADRTATGLTAGLVTASALLDVLTGEEVDRLAAACVEAGCPALLTLSVVGQVELTPADPLDAELTAAFNAHQRRRTGGRRLLGPEAVDAAAAAFTRHGAAVRVADSPWRLGAAHTALTGEWLRGWVAAACEQRSELAGPAAPYLTRRLAAAAAGELRVVVGHRDLLAYPG